MRLIKFPSGFNFSSKIIWIAKTKTIFGFKIFGKGFAFWNFSKTKYHCFDERFETGNFKKHLGNYCIIKLR